MRNGSSDTEKGRNGEKLASALNINHQRIISHTKGFVFFSRSVKGEQIIVLLGRRCFKSTVHERKGQRSCEVARTQSHCELEGKFCPMKRRGTFSWIYYLISLLASSEELISKRISKRIRRGIFINFLEKRERVERKAWTLSITRNIRLVLHSVRETSIVESSSIDWNISFSESLYSIDLFPLHV